MLYCYETTWRHDNSKKLNRDIELTSILYLHRIGEKRLIIKPPISVFKRLCPDDPLKRVIFVTTHWDRVPLKYGQAQEQKLQGYFENELKFPARMERSDMTTEAARAIVKRILG